LTKHKEGFHTSSFSIVDDWGNILVCTSTIQAELGSGYVVPGRGFFLNNELTDFDTGINAIEGGARLRRTALAPLNATMGGKRPRSSMAPTIVFKDGEPKYGLGSPNGPFIISAVAQVMLNLIDFGMGMEEAVTAPRVASMNNIWFLENEFGKYLNDLQGKYAPFIIQLPGIGVVSIVEYHNNGNYSAVADLRKPTSVAISI